MTVVGLEIDELTSPGDSAVTLKLAGELDIDSVRALERVAERHLAAGRTVLTLDLSDLMFIDSTGLAAIVLVSRLCELEGRELSIIRGPRRVQRLFEITGLIDVLPFEVSDRATSEDVAQPNEDRAKPFAASEERARLSLPPKG